MAAPIRLLPERPLPPYTYVPGQAPHPIRDPEGHMHGQPSPTPQLLIDEWWNCAEYLWGIDLFNQGYYWEAHEAWEGLWHAAGRRGPVADFLKGLIKLAAAGVKTSEGSAEGRRRHLSRAAELFLSTRLALGPQFMGFDAQDYLNAVECAPWPPVQRVDPLKGGSQEAESGDCTSMPARVLPALSLQRFGTSSEESQTRIGP